LSLRGGTTVDATIIAAPSSTKNVQGKRDPDMHQTRKGNQWYFGMKAHIGVDDASGLVHHVRCTAAKVADITQTHKLLHGDEDTVCGDSGYTGADTPPCFMGFGKRPDLTPEYQVALLTGIMPGVAATPFWAFRPMMSQMRTKPSAGKPLMTAVLGAAAGICGVATNGNSFAWSRLPANCSAAPNASNAIPKSARTSSKMSLLISLELP